MILACGLPFHFGEIAMISGGILMGAAIVGKLCWCYLKSKFARMVKGCNATCGCECKCDCCEHETP